MSRGGATLGAAVLLALLFAGCVTSSQGTDGNALILGDPRISGLDRWPGAFQSSLAHHDFDGDGVDEIVAHNTDRNVYVFSATTGRALAVLPTKYPPAWYIQQVSNGVEVAALEPGQPPSIVVANHAAFVAAWRFVPEESDKERFVFTKSWEVRTSACHRSPSMDGRATLADLDRDGRLDVVVQTEEVGLFAYDSRGKPLWHKCWAGGNGSPVVADLDGDGNVEAIFASDSGFVSVLRGRDGEPVWTFDARKHGVYPASISVSPTVGDLDGDGLKEVLFTARHAPKDDPNLFDSFHMAIFAVHQRPGTWQPEVLWMRQPEWANPLSYTQLVVHDVDDDGLSEVFGMDWNTIGHRPGDWERLGPGHAFRLDHTGADVWVREVDAWWSNKDIALADLDGDGELDVVVNGPRDGVDGLWRLSVETGAAQGFHGAPGWKLLGGPLFMDLRRDGTMQLAYRVTPADDRVDAATPLETNQLQGAIRLVTLSVPFEAPRRGSG